MTGVTSDHGDRQRLALLMFIRGYKKENGYMPSIQEMADATGMFRNSVTWHLRMLRDQGRVDFEDGKIARSLKVVR